MTLIIPYDTSPEEPIQFRVIDKNKGIDFLVPISTSTAVIIAEDLLKAVRRRIPRDETVKPKVRVQRKRVQRRPRREK